MIAAAAGIAAAPYWLRLFFTDATAAAFFWVGWYFFLLGGIFWIFDAQLKDFEAEDAQLKAEREREN